MMEDFDPGLNEAEGSLAIPGATTSTAVLDPSRTGFFDDDSLNPMMETERAPCLIVIRGVLPGSIHPLTPGRNRLGRATENECRLTERSISRFHAEVVVESDGLALATDLGSSNGTYLNGHRLTSHNPIAISEGDRLRLGAVTLLKFAWLDAREQRFHREMLDRSSQDRLTGLANREYLLNRAAEVFAGYTSKGLGTAVLMLDIDNLKEINDRHGYASGNEVLQALAASIRETLPRDALAARYGGEEFVIIMSADNLGDAAKQAEDVRLRLSRRSYRSPKGTFRIPISAGLAFASIPPAWDVLISAADVCLFQGKSMGGNRSVSCQIDDV